MTTKQRKRICRIKVERLAKIITCVLVLACLTVGSALELDGYVVSVVCTLIWFFAPDVAAYALERKYKISHNYTYR